MATKDLDRRGTARREDLAELLLPVVERSLDGGTSYLDLRVEDVIRAAGIGRATFYRYFEDKNDLLRAVSATALEDIATAAFKPWDLPPSASREERRAAMRRTIDAYRPHLSIMRAMVEVASYDPDIQTLYHSGFETARQNAAQRIRDGQRDGNIRKDLPPDETAAWLTWMAERGLYQLLPGADEPALERLTDSLTAIFWHTIYEPTPASNP